MTLKDRGMEILYTDTFSSGIDTGSEATVYFFLSSFFLCTESLNFLPIPDTDLTSISCKPTMENLHKSAKKRLFMVDSTKLLVHKES